MSAPVFLLRPIPGADRLTLDGPEGRHAATVRRMRAGERLDVTDGAGELAECLVASVGRDRLELEVQRRVQVAEASPRIVVIQALIKGDRSQLAVDLLTEVGVDEIVPWQAARCVAAWAPERSARRWEQAAAEAAKQSRRARWPLIAPLATTAALTERMAAAAATYVLHESAPDQLVPLLKALPQEGELIIVVGPEGGLTDGEIEAFAACGARPVRLGAAVLRASTAGCAAAAVLLAACGRWG